VQLSCVESILRPQTLNPSFDLLSVEVPAHGVPADAELTRQFLDLGTALVPSHQRFYLVWSQLLGGPYR
jgi:hypothetical protein